MEAQHRVSTIALVDTLEEQTLLEQILENSKPPLPPEAQGKHYLLTTPFRYPPRLMEAASEVLLIREYFTALTRPD